ncbi:MAG: PAS domain-containing protein, partial [Parvularcula sp.]|nr:PAS domain-containing protein [Parvularcula sp.]
MTRVEGTLRPVAPLDLHRSPDLQHLVDAWHGPDRLRLPDLDSGPLAHLRDDLLIVERQSDGGFLYTHCGESIAARNGFSMLGKRTSEFRSSIGAFFAHGYCKALEHGEPLYSVNKAKAHQAHSWHRLLLPVSGLGETGSDCVLAYARPLTNVPDILSKFAESTGFLGGTLEPRIREGRVVDFTLMPLCDPTHVPGLGHVKHLSDLLGSRLDEAMLDRLAYAERDEVVIECELPPSDTRFGHTFLLTVTGGAPQNVFALSDVTDLVAARNAAAERQSAMEDFARTASDWLWETDTDHRFTYMSEAICEQTGSLPERYIGVDWFDLEHVPENLAAFKEHRRVRQAHQPFRGFVYKAFRDDGSHLWIRSSGKPRFRADGTFLGYRGTCSDITAEIEAREAADEHKSAMEDFAKTASDWLWETDANHVFTMISEAVEAFIGRPASSLLGLSPLDLLNTSANQESVQAHKADLAARRPFTGFVYQVDLEDGRTVWARTSGLPRYAKDGTFLGYRGTGSNITKEIEAREQAERRSAELAEAHRLGRLGAWSFNIIEKSVTLSAEFR